MHCHKSFITKDTLTKHLSVHNETRNFKCGQCGKLFKRISHVREHLKIHTMDRPFNCTVCRKTFKTNVSTGTRYIISELGTTVFIVYVYVSLFKLNRLWWYSCWDFIFRMPWRFTCELTPASCLMFVHFVAEDSERKGHCSVIRECTQGSGHSNVITVIGRLLNMELWIGI